MVKTKRWIATVLLLVVAGAGALAQEATQTESWTVEIDGRKTWTVRYGFGDALALASASIGPGDFALEQTLAVDFTATALSIFRVEGHFDDQASAESQSLSLYLDTENMHGVAGDFTAPNLGSFFAGSRTMVGARVDYLWSEGSAVAIASQLSGVRDSRQFVGQSASGERTFAGRRSDDGAVYAATLDGLGYVALRDLYVEDFTEMTLTLSAGGGVQQLLEQFGVPELREPLEVFPGLAMDAGEAVVVGTDVQFLLLRIDPVNLVRNALREAVRAYNKVGDGEDISYPFVAGSEVETEFLTRLAEVASLVVGPQSYGVTGLEWNRFYDLGQDDIAASSLSVAVRLHGEEYLEVGDPDLVGYAVTLYAEQGVLEAHFPDVFFQAAEASVVASFSYPIVGGAYLLGGAVIPGSERASMAGRPLVKGVDYTIDYEVGLFALLVSIEPTDALVVEFERYAGSGSYGRMFYGAALSIPAGDGLTLSTYALRGVDRRASVSNPESVKTMPNSQTVVGVAGSVTERDFTADFSLGYADDAFPFDDNAREAIPNRVRAIAASSGTVFLGHEAGFAARSDGKWRVYATGSGLSGREVRAIVVDGDRVFLGTESGLTAVRLTGISPLDKVANWSRYGKTDGLLDPSVGALAVVGDRLWVGTESGLFFVDIAEMEDPGAWSSLDDPAFVGVTALAADGDVLWVGTSQALLRVDRLTGAVLSADEGDSVNDLCLVAGEGVYAAGSLGVRRFDGDLLVEWVARGEAALTLAPWQGDVFYGTESGMVRTSDGQRLYGEWTISELSAAGGALWVGTEGRNGELLVWSRAAGETAYDARTTGIEPANPRAYRDVLARDHKTTGWMANASFSHEGDGYSLTGMADRILPGFRAIDSGSRQDVGGWAVGTEVALGSAASVSFDQSVRLSDPESEDARTTADNRLVLDGSFGPKLSLAVDYHLEDRSTTERGFDRRRLNYDIDLVHDLFDESLRVTIGWGEGFQWDEGRSPRRDTSLAATASWDIGPDLSTSLSFSRPVRIGSDGASGSERWQWSTDGTLDFGGVGLAATYDVDVSRALPRGSAHADHDATFAFTVPAYSLGAWSVAPTLNVAGSLANSAGTLSGQLGVRATATGITARATASVDVSGLGSRTQRWSEKLASSVSYTAIEGFRPTLSYTGTRTVTQVEGKGEKVSWSQALNGRLTLSGRGGFSESLTVSGRIQSSGSASLSLANSMSSDVTVFASEWIPALAAIPEAGSRPTVMARTDVAGEWRRDGAKDDASWRIGAACDISLSETWSFSLGVTYRGGVKTAQEAFHGVVAEMTVAIDF